MSRITTHVLDLSKGLPASQVEVTLEIVTVQGAWKSIGTGFTDDEGRLNTLLPADVPLQFGTYRLTFETGAYYALQQTKSFYPQVTIVFVILNTEQHYHVPLLLSPFGYSTYRGS